MCSFGAVIGTVCANGLCFERDIALAPCWARWQKEGFAIHRKPLVVRL